MKRFAWFVVVVLVAGVAGRYFMKKWPFEPSVPDVVAPEGQQPVEPVAKPEVRQTSPHPIDPTDPTSGKPSELPPSPAPAPSRIAGAREISDDGPRYFATAPGVIYYCWRDGMVAQPKSGGARKVVGRCEDELPPAADADGIVYCQDKQLRRITTGGGEEVIVDHIDCLLPTLDGKYVYFVVPGFEGIENPGVYRVERAGGKPERVHATHPREQYSLIIDDEAVWIAGWGAGTISKLAKTAGAKAKTVISGQKGIVDFGVDKKWVYWYAETTGEIRRRTRTGGTIEVVGKGVDQEPLVVVDGHAYWFEGTSEKRLMHLAPGAVKAVELASALRQPSLAADSEGVYVTELEHHGLFMFKR